MPKIFISYRREDSIAFAGRICDKLVVHFGKDSVFMDVDSIPFGVDFRQHLTDAVSGCDVFLALIGEDWLTVNQHGQRRLDDPRDFVRIEIEAALQRGIPVIPVLLGRASMPQEDELPAVVAGLVYRQAAHVDPGQDFHGHVDRLIRGLELYGNPPRSSPAIETTKAATKIPAQDMTSPHKVGETRVNSVGMKFVWVPPGCFMRGSTGSVTLTRGFFLGMHQVTQAQWEAVVENNPSHFKGSDLPVESVSWNDCVSFCKKLAKRDGKDYRLPTEAEWEYACRADSNTRFCYGDNPTLLVDYGWFWDNSSNTTHPVGEKTPNEWGLHDMHGNVWEWCSDYFGEYLRKDGTDPQGPAKGAMRCLRGGSWYDYAIHAASDYRWWSQDSYFANHVGFRVCLKVDDSQSS